MERDKWLATDQGARLEIRYVNETAPQSHQVDAETLAASLIHAQRALHLLALVAAGREFRERLRVPAELAREFRLVCDVPAEGSYLQGLQLEGSGAVLDVPSREDVVDKFAAVGAALSEGSWDTLRELVPDTIVRQRVVDEFISFLPSPHSEYGLDVIRYGSRRAVFRRPQIMAVREYTRDVRADSGASSSPVTITGALVLC